MSAPRSLAGRLGRPGARLRRLPVTSRIALGVLLVVVLGAVFAPLLTQDPLATGIPARAPGADHWFGTDRAGRDVFARVVHGARYSLVIGLGATLAALVLGSALGALAATSRRLADESVMRTLDVVMSFPPIALAAVLVAVFGPSVPVIIFTIAFVYSPSLARVVRANVLEQYGEDYVAAERVVGARRGHIVVRHVAINCAAPVLVFATVMVADSIIFEASLSFIGAGVQDPDPSWGSVLAYGRQILLSGGWWATLFPGLCVLVTVLALNVLSEGMTDAAASPDTSRTGGTDSDATAATAPAAERADGAEVDAALAELASRLRATEPAVPPLAADAADLLVVRDLSIRFPDRYGDTRVVDGISFTVREGETLGLVGESGCGKSVTSLAVMGLLARNAEAAGEIRYRGRDLLKLTPKERRALMGPEIAMVYQDAMSSLNPSVLIGTQLKWLTSRGGTRTPAEMLELVGLSPERTLRSYPHELSGGQRQRVLIAMALSRGPRLLIADEPTTALDVTVQAQVVELLVRLRDELGFAMVLVSHDLALVGDLAHRVAVMYAGQVAETGETRALLTDPAHHYSRGLLGSVVSLESGAERLHQIRGVVPAPKAFGAGCRFASRCAAATELCATTPPPATDREAGLDHLFACHHPASALRPPSADRPAAGKTPASGDGPASGGPSATSLERAR
ncbi:dipeptide/oligopeptide/nickel ABC transporter permease/ATP-binding protein [Streptomyces olivaceus]|uniref:Dipeptide/oligopeptide/nickel ABC transporter permease/ATP-binding protein n=1 Tax=Streptomyces olivaceus TaxID=47716 RepID=A0ABS7W967_STROV|nr:dipeptide/oligopeptide/nickel ABC transporter permease/ATP-binding protein [Streptomyces olivaceus]MBZ6091523.1 dipeptide/oligopeptide/nickel ABC transporter permease/ATP-binding protein [Streptomyces olivaceus]MBZ6098043.1 dipeptide/oligopeptide/nickel ABC transporter permease/ATP-binding protein [Streptomyces olivaceus]MBZ6118580.1 dipeptide/oligopeptide/nickel ABC transporter permease/ATP-binding protein [Streptomyces olivaceus]MBZ6154023.1 dipeptide/oligopeptide/nickel ABC transporter pe